MIKSQFVIVQERTFYIAYRGVFRTQLNIYDEAFLSIQLTAKLFS